MSSLPTPRNLHARTPSHSSDLGTLGSSPSLSSLHVSLSAASLALLAGTSSPTTQSEPTRPTHARSRSLGGGDPLSAAGRRGAPGAGQGALLSRLRRSLELVLGVSLVLWLLVIFVTGHGRFDVSPRSPGQALGAGGGGRPGAAPARPLCPELGAPPAGRFLLPRAAYSPGRAGGRLPRVFVLTAVSAESADSSARLAAFLAHYEALGVAPQHMLVLAQTSSQAPADQLSLPLAALADAHSVFLDVWVGPLPPFSVVAARWKALLGRHARRSDWAFVFDADELLQLPANTSLPQVAAQAARLGYTSLLASRTEVTKPAGAGARQPPQVCVLASQPPCAGVEPRAPVLVGGLGAASPPRLRPLLDVGFDDRPAVEAVPGKPLTPYPVPFVMHHTGWGGGAEAARDAASRAAAVAACLGATHPASQAAQTRAEVLLGDGGWLTRAACSALACAPSVPSEGSPDSSPLASALSFPAGSRRIAIVTSVWDHVDGVSKTLQTVSAQLLEGRADTRVLLLTPDVGAGSLSSATLAIAAAAAAAKLPGLAVCPIPSLPAPGRPDYRWAPPLTGRASAELALFRPDAVHAAAPDFLGHSAVAWARANGVCSLCTYHTAFPTYLQYYGVGIAEPLVAAFMASFYRRCDYVAVPTHAAADDLAAAGVPRSKMGFFPRGIDTALYSPSHRSEDWRRDVALAAEGELVVLWVARMVREKGLDTFAAALLQLWQAERRPRFRVVVAGTGPDLEWLQRRLPPSQPGAAPEGGLTPPVTYLGHSKGGSLSTALASSDVFFFPSRTEVFPNNVAEAMASGLAVLAEDVGVVRALVTHNLTGLLVEPERRGGGAWA